MAIATVRAYPLVALRRLIYARVGWLGHVLCVLRTLLEDKRVTGCIELAVGPEFRVVRVQLGKSPRVACFRMGNSQSA